MFRNKTDLIGLLLLFTCDEQYTRIGGISHLMAVAKPMLVTGSGKSCAVPKMVLVRAALV